MDREVHHGFTLRWAVEAGFTDAEARVIADADWACDRVHTGLLGKRFHWPALGSRAVARGRFRDAVRSHDLVALGEALHATQDSVGHGFLGHFYHWPGIDRWAQRGLRVRQRIEAESKRMLHEYRVRCGLAESVTPPPRTVTGVFERASRAIEVVLGDRDDVQGAVLSTLGDVADAVSSGLGVDGVLEVIAERLRRITGAEKAVIVLAHEHDAHVDHDTIVVRGPRARHSQDWWEERLDVLAEQAFATDGPVIETRPDHGAVIIATPLKVRERPVGMLYAINRDTRPFTPEHITYVRVLSTFAAAAVDNARLADERRYVLLASERDRIAREMHDGVVQSLFSISLGLEVCKKRIYSSPAEVAERLGELQEHLNTSMAELRRFIYDLRPVRLTELGLVGATEYWVREITRGTGVHGRVRAPGRLPALEPAEEACLYRVAKEAVSNVMKHAGAASFEVRFEADDDGVTMTISDDGRGFDVGAVFAGETQGMGLRSIRQRVDADGGRLSVESVPGRGTHLTVFMPLGGAADGLDTDLHRR